MGKYRIGIDVGGTFTDAIAVNEENGELRSAKTPTTPEDQSKGVIAALNLLDVAPREISLFIHGCTVGINAIITRSGVKIGLLCTKGFRDVLAQARNSRPADHVLNPRWQRPHEIYPLVERRYRRGVKERIGGDGKELLSLDEEQARREIRFLKNEGIESIAVCFMNAYVNPEHEERVKNLVEEEFPEAYVVTSEISPLSREFERTTTVVFDAYIGPVVRRYIEHLDKAVKDFGYKDDVMIVQMTGGVQNIGFTAKRPVFIINSGPVAGCVGTHTYGEWLNVPNIISMDIGGTSTDISMVANNELPLAGDLDIEFFMPVQMPLITVQSVGAGGGSLVSLGIAGNLCVGPESAGAVPGPACYGRGGSKPTLCDAHVAMGTLQPDYFLGGRMKLYPDKSEVALHSIAKTLGMTNKELAQAVYELANLNIAESIRSLALYRGEDLSKFALLTYGSGGAMHGCYIARELGMPEVIVPRHPGVFSAFGMSTCDLRVDYTSAPLKMLHLYSPDELDSDFAKLEGQAIADLRAQGISKKHIKTNREYYGMYTGQTWDKRVPISVGPYNASSQDAMINEFHERNLRYFGYEARELSIIVTRIVGSAIAEIPRPVKFHIPMGKATPPSDAMVARRDIYLDGKVNHGMPIYARDKLLAGNVIEGPALVVEDLSTTVLGGGSKLRIDDMGNLRIIVPSRVVA